MTQSYTLIYILGSGHCGSTLLDLLLNGHSQILSLGEMNTLKRYIGISKQTPEIGATPQVVETLQPPSRQKDWLEIRQNLMHLPFWQEVKQCYDQIAEVPFENINSNNPTWRTLRSWREEDIEKWIQPQKILLSCIHQRARTPFLTDSSKFPHRLYLFQQCGLFNIKVLHLLRDGHAVINSYIRKYGDFRLALRRWAGPTLLAFYMRRYFATSQWLRLRYEDLVLNPENSLRSICAFLDINYEPAMLSYRQHPYIGLGGNGMRARADEHIVLDEKWREELNRKHRLAFAIAAGWLNRLYGY